jgi:hypothetical protein
MVTFRWYGVHRWGLSVVGTEFWNFGGPPPPATVGTDDPVATPSESGPRPTRRRVADRCGRWNRGDIRPGWGTLASSHRGPISLAGVLLLGCRHQIGLMPSCLTQTGALEMPVGTLNWVADPVLGARPLNRPRMSGSHPSHGGGLKDRSRRFRHLRAESLTGATDVGSLRRLRAADWSASTTSDRADRLVMVGPSWRLRHSHSRPETLEGLSPPSVQSNHRGSGAPANRARSTVM